MNAGDKMNYTYRMGTKTLKIPNAKANEVKAVAVKQIRHKFLFGCSEFSAKGEWWSGEQALATDCNSEVTVTGFLGDYIAVCEGREMRFSIE